MDGRSARDELWRRYDDGTIGAEELEARLRLVDRAGDEATLRTALDGPLGEVGPRRRTAIVGGVGAALVAAVALPLVFLGDGSDGAATVGTATTGAVVAPPVVPVPVAPSCPEADDALAAIEAAALDELPANPALLSDPPVTPEGYTVDDDEEVVPGTDPDVAMQVLAGTPPPVAIRARTLRGDLDVTMRAFRFASVEEAGASGASVVANGVCNFGAEGFAVPDRPELTGSVVEGPIPLTTFVNFRLGDRRFSVAVVVAGDGGAEELAAAQALAGQVAALELDAARRAPGAESQVGTVPAVPAGPATTIPGTTIPGG